MPKKSTQKSTQQQITALEKKLDKADAATVALMLEYIKLKAKKWEEEGRKPVVKVSSAYLDWYYQEKLEALTAANALDDLVQHLEYALHLSLVGCE